MGIAQDAEPLRNVTECGHSRVRDSLTLRKSGLGDPLNEGAGLDMKETTERVERLGVHAPERASFAGQPVGAGVTQVGALAEGIRRYMPCLHDRMDPEPYHGEPSR